MYLNVDLNSNEILFIIADNYVDRELFLEQGRTADQN